MQIDEVIMSAKVAAKHAVSADEVEEVFMNEEEEMVVRRSPRGGDSYLALGRTAAGRYLTAPFIFIGEGVIYILTARDMTDTERGWFNQQ
jgi:hypothetical protein